MKPLFVSRFSPWAPGLSSPADWKAWSRGEQEIPHSGEGPALEYTEPLFRRRLSQVSRMAVQVVHSLLPLGERTEIVFLSFRGEITQQFKINKLLITEDSVTPAAFSLSVFNTPPALASIAFGLSAGYTALYPREGDFAAGLAAAAAPVLCGAAEELLLVYADELVPEAYNSMAADSLPETAAAFPPPLAFGVLITAAAPGIPLPLGEAAAGDPRALLTHLLEQGEPYAVP